MKIPRLTFWKKEEQSEEEITSPLKKRFSIVLLFLMIVVAAYLQLSPVPESVPEVSTTAAPTLSFGTTTIALIVADTDALRERGLSGRTGLPPLTGMLFEFETDSYPAIWMKDMLFAIDIIWLDKNFRVVDVAENISPLTYPKIFSPREPARFVLEVPAGFSSLHGVRRGVEADFVR